MWLHVEISSRCNAWCPGCGRNKNGYGLADNLVEQDLDPAILKSTLEKYSVTEVQMCGNLGDPCAAKNIDDHLKIVADSSVVRLQIHTNGSLRKPEWWANLVKQFEHLEQFDVYFALDGLADTHSIYRQGTSYARVIENATAFIDAGGNATWQFIPFKHNEHQINDCLKLSQDLGFKKFEFLKNARYQKMPDSKHYQTGELLGIQPWSRDKLGDNKYHLNKTPTKVDKQDCMHLQIPSLFLNATGKISPCCYMGNTVQYTEVDIETEFNNNNYRNVCLTSCGK